jgi:hypothetical protein
MTTTPSDANARPPDLDQAVLAQIVERANSPDFEGWWAAAAHSGFCANPVHLAGGQPGFVQAEVLSRCKNRRAVVCPSCSALYAGDTWQLVHAGIAGGHHGLPDTVTEHPMVFVTLTAPGFGAVHSDGRLGGQNGQVCHPGAPSARCRHGNAIACGAVHDSADPLIGQSYNRKLWMLDFE